ncbi:hypothetical protein Deipe_4165 (plasmid) [Deinococcus peraridilitoris DSM 19664]|uniref:Uncharacterized protein n=2 Tax=Deinococcus TaxID=1298 RepID=L0A8P8_DEIPD|nr:hypothetical protein Deipe_4165 [Deinococcus peraridilitoris DSM 19664]
MIGMFDPSLIRPQRAVVSRAFRETLLGRMPRLRDQLAYWRPLGHVLFTPFLDEYQAERGAVIPRPLAAALEGKEKELRGGRYRSLLFLTGFVDACGLEATLSPYDHEAGRARVLTLRLEPALDAGLQQELRTPQQQLFEPVDFETGKAVGWRGVNERWRQVRQHVAVDPSHPNADGVRYLNGVSPRVYAPHRERLDAAYGVCLTLPATKVDANLRILRSLPWQFEPTYQQVRKSPRIYTIGSSLALCSGVVRRCLLHDAAQYDLENAQPAVVACLWDIPDIHALLREHGSIWPLLLRQAGLSDEHKPSVKICVYAAVFGRTRWMLRQVLAKDIGEERAERLLASPVFQSLLDARDRRMKAIKRDGGMRDAFGRFHPLEPQSRNIRTLLAYEAQSYEVKLMWPIFDLARRTDDYSIVLWLHDGFYVRSHDRSKFTRQMRRLLGAVERQAQELNIPTRLVASA